MSKQNHSPEEFPTAPFTLVIDPLALPATSPYPEVRGLLAARIKAFCENPNDGTAGDLVRAIGDGIGIQTLSVHREDVESHMSRPLTDEEWAKVRGSYEWDNIFDGMMDDYWFAIDNLIDCLDLPAGDKDDDYCEE